ncbi:hypothetical protein [Bradyrhizobium sp. STM 3566]|uniref:hypothetical protein n=1 Tax=Bradyrhizobium sp. STM 3566 TaxID=578928 RepID=UPI00388F78AA
MEETSVKGLHYIDVRNDKGETTKAALEIKFKRIAVLPPIGKQKRYPALDLTIIHATERGTPKGRKPIEWKLITDLAVRSRSEAIEKINWYAMRGKWRCSTRSEIGLQGGRLKTPDRGATCQSNGGLLHSQLARPLAHHAQSHRPRRVTEARIDGHRDRVARSNHQRRQPSTMSPWNPAFYLTKLARLGGYLARAGDPPPGNVVIWRGLSRLTDIELGAEIAAAGRLNRAAWRSHCGWLNT